MASQRWYQKASVQAAIVSGVVAVLVALIGLLKTPGGDIASGERRVASHTGATGKYDQFYSAESVAARRSLRAGLRNASAGESGLKIEQLPLGTFAFAHPLLFTKTNFDVDWVPNGRLSFEVHKISAVEVYAIAFVNADTHRKLLRDSDLSEPATLYSDLWQDAPYGARVKIASCSGEHRIIRRDDGRAEVIAVDCAPRKGR